MMEVTFSDSFNKTFRKRIRGTPAETVFLEKLEVFIQQPFNPQLITYKLSGRLKDLWSFSIEYDLRVLFFFH